MSKTKINFLIFFVLLLAGLGVMVLGPLRSGRRAAPDIQGAWEGALQVQSVTLRLVLKIEKTPDGSYTATVDSVDQGSKDIPVQSLTLSNDTVRAELKSLGAAYNGRINARATEIAGQWHQRGRDFPLTLRRTTNPSTIAASSPGDHARRADAPLQGSWRGTIDADGTPLRVAFNITSQGAGKYRGTMASLDQGAKNIPLSSLEFSDPSVQLAVDSVGGQYEGSIKSDGTQIDGRWLQGGKEFALLLKRAAPGEDAPPPASAYVHTRNTEPQGIWTGTLDVQGTRLRLVFKIARAADGTFSALMDSLDQGARDVPATSATFKEPDVKLEWKAMQATYHGQLEGGKLKGFWQQGPIDFPLDLERTNRPPATATPAKP